MTTTTTQEPKPKNVAIKAPSPSLSSASSSSGAEKSVFALPGWLAAEVRWIPANWTWAKIKPAVRCAVAGWLAVVLFVIPQVQVYMGQASFLVLISSFMSPPSDPFLAVLERELLIIIFVSLAWAWSCLGIRLADLARVNRDPSVSFAAAVTGQYVEAAPSVILGVFMFFGSVFLLYIRARQGPGPYLFPAILGCICLDISLTTAALFPYPFYRIGQSIIIPLGFRSAIAVLCSIFIFPQTVSALYTSRIQAVLKPLVTTLDLHQKLLATPTDSSDFSTTAAAIVAAAKKSESELIPLTVAGRLLASDLIWCRFAPPDFRVFQQIARRMTVRANGMTIYFTLIDPTRERFPTTPAASRPGTPSLAGTPIRSKNPSFEHIPVPDSPAESTADSGREKRKSALLAHHSLGLGHHHHHPNPHHKHKHLVHNSLLHIPLPSSLPKTEQAVGVFESQRYIDLENTHFGEHNAAELTSQTVGLLAECCDSLLGRCKEALEGIDKWFGRLRVRRWGFWPKAKKEREKLRKEGLEEMKKLREKLVAELEMFREKGRHRVLDPYRPAFDEADPMKAVPPHRYLFHSYVYEYHLMRFTSMIIEILDEILRLETTRTTHKLWTPAQHLFNFHPYNLAEGADDQEEEDPDTIQGLDPTTLDDLGIARRRDPDALPPRNAFEWVLSHLYKGVAGLGGGNALYAVKAGVLTVLMCIPVFLKSTAGFAYEHKFVWAIIMAQLTLARFRGDTAFGLSARIFSTLMGGVVGMVMWYISQGNPYGLAAVCAVCFPFFFYARLYWTAPPMRVIIFFVTTLLVLGYSFMDVYNPLPGSPGVGWDVAWRRFVLVTAGVAAAFIFSFLPPSRTIRLYQRATLSTAMTEIGALYCAIISFAHSHTDNETQEIVTSLIAIRRKLNASFVLRSNAVYEFSFRGRWPAARYAKILDLETHIAYSLSHLFSVIEHLEPKWTMAFLRRTRFTDPDFQGDVLAVITLIANALKDGTPLPQITPCPLLDRYLMRYHGLSVVHEEAEEDFGLPRFLSLEVIGDEQYLMFSVALATTYGIISRLDRLMVAVKEIVGEQYHIHGLQAGLRRRSDLNDLRLPQSQDV